VTEEERKALEERLEMLNPFYESLSNFIRARILATDSSVIDKENMILLKENLKKKLKGVID